MTTIFQVSIILLHLFLHGCGNDKNEPESSRTPPSCPEEVTFSESELAAFKAEATKNVRQDESLAPFIAFEDKYLSQLNTIAKQTPGLYLWKNDTWEKTTDFFSVIRFQFDDGTVGTLV